jgi:TP901-1 family phage major tail protein
MPASIQAVPGRTMLLKCDFSGFSPTSYTTLTGLRATQIKINGAEVDITNKNSNGWQELLALAGVRRFELTASGIYDDTPGDAMLQLEQCAVNGTFINCEIIFGTTPSAVMYVGQFAISDLTLDGPYDNTMTFSITLKNNAVVQRFTV